MPKTLDTDYKSKLWSGTANGLQKLIKTELDIYPTYVSPIYKETGNLGIRIFPISVNHEDRLGSDEWRRSETLEIVLYCKSKSMDDRLYEQFFNDFDNIYQLIYDNKTYPPLSSRPQWWDAVIDNVVFEQLTEDEAEIDNLHSIAMEFSCITTQKI